MRRIGIALIVVCGVAFFGVALRSDDDHGRDGRAARGLELSPVPVHVTRQNRELVGLGSYIVNAKNFLAGGVAYSHRKAIPHAEPGSFFGGNCPAPGLAKPPA
jgi:hypothetical protein